MATPEHAALVGFTNLVMGKLFSEIDGKIKQLKGVRGQSESLRRELNMLLASKMDELTGSRDRDASAPAELAREHGEQIRELIHDIEDCIERFLHRITCEQQRGGGVAGVLRRAVHRVRTLGIRNQFAKEMEKLKKRLMESRNPGTNIIPVAAAGEPRCLPMENSPVGITKAKEDLLKLLGQVEGEDNKLRVISIVGFGGSGKTTLANAVYKSAATGGAQRQGFFPLRAWIHRSHYNDPRGLLLKIVTEFWGASAEADHKDKDEWKLQDYLLENLREQRYLIVLVDIDTKHYWKWIQLTLKNNNKSSRIIVTTTKLSSAKHCSKDDGYVYQMRNLGHEASNKIALGNQQNAAGDYNSAKALVDKCDGHPLALVSVGNHISGGIMSSPNRHHHCTKLGSFLHAAPSIGEDHFIELRRVLMNNYTSLCCCTLQPSLLYLGIFPNKDCGNLKKKKLTRRWVAEGYARSSDPRRSEQEVAEENFMGFIDLNMIQPVGVSSSTCRALGIVHEFVVDKSISDNFIMPFNAPERRINSCAHGHEEKVRHLFVSDHNNAANPGRTLNMDLSRVRSLTVSSQSANGAFSKFSKFHLMRVLDLENCTEVNSRQLRRICKLWNLRYLSLKDNIKKIPKNINRLKLLETLTVSENEVTELPLEVLGMPCLIHLTGKFMLPKKLPQEEKLKKLCEENRLQTLAGFVSIRNQAFLQLMVHSKNLTKVKVWYKSAGEDGDSNNKLNDAIKEYSKTALCHGQVRSLSVDLQSCAQWPQLPYGEGIKYHLSSLKLQGNLSTMSHQFDAFLLSVEDGLTDLSLSLTLLTRELLSAVSGMSYLVHLKLAADEVADEVLVIELGQLKMLQHLYFAVRKPDAAIPRLDVQDGYFPELISLQLLSKQLGGTCGIEIRHLTKLHEIELHPEVSEPARQEWEVAARNHRNRPNVLPFKSVDDPAAGMTLEQMETNPVAGQTPVGDEDELIESHLSASAEQPVGDAPAAVVPVPVVTPAGDVPAVVPVPDTRAVLVANVPADDPVASVSPADDSASSTHPTDDKSLDDPVAGRGGATRDESSIDQEQVGHGYCNIGMAPNIQHLNST